MQKIKGLNGVKWNGVYALPLINARFLPEDALRYSDEISNVGVYPDSQVYIEYRKMAVSLKGNDFFKPASVNSVFKYTLDAGEQNLLDGGTVIMERDQIIDWTHPTAKVDSILFKSGKFHIQVENSINHSLNLTVILLGAMPESAASQSIQIPWTGQTGQAAFDIDLSGVLADLSRGQKSFNQLRFRIRATYTNTSGGRINGSDQLTCSFTANDLVWHRVHGRFNDREILNRTEDMRLGALSADFTANNTVFKDARLKVRWENTYGIPMSLNLNSLGFIEGDGTRSLISGTNKTHLINAASAQKGNPLTEFDSLYLTAGNSNIAALVEKQPHYLFWNESLFTQSGSTPQKETIWYESTCSVSISLELPLYFETKGIKINASTDLNDNWKSEAGNLDWIVFRLDIRNDLPLSLGVQAYFLDENNNILDSLLNPYYKIIPAAFADSMGTAISSHEKQIDIRLEKPKIMGIINARRIYMEARLQTSEIMGKPVERCKIRQGQGLDVKLGIHSSLNIYRKF